MAHHAYFYAGEQEAGVAAAFSYAKETLGLTAENNPDVIIFRYGLFSVDDARRVIRLASQSAVGDEGKFMVISAERIFHEAQNALLKLFEEPPPNTTLVLVVPSSGILLTTLRSRMLPLVHKENALNAEAQEFIDAAPAAREKLIGKLLERTKSDKDEEKQAARGEALRLLEGLQMAAYGAWQKKKSKDLQLFMGDLDRFIPILHERSAPLKLIFEHILLTVPNIYL
jgi:DNA polymerase III delta prime subunit